MVESEANILPEEVMLGAVVYGHEQLNAAVTAIKEFAAEVGTQPWDWQPKAENLELKRRWLSWQLMKWVKLIALPIKPRAVMH